MNYNPEELRGLFKYVNKEVKPYWIQSDEGMSDRFSLITPYTLNHEFAKGGFITTANISFELPLEFLEVV